MLSSAAMSATVSEASYEAYALPLNLPLTTGAGPQYRRGLLLRVGMESLAVNGTRPAAGVAEIAPLPGRQAGTKQLLYDACYLTISCMRLSHADTEAWCHVYCCYHAQCS